MRAERCDYCRYSRYDHRFGACQGGGWIKWHVRAVEADPHALRCHLRHSQRKKPRQPGRARVAGRSYRQDRSLGIT